MKTIESCEYCDCPNFYHYETTSVCTDCHAVVDAIETYEDDY